MSSQNSKQSPPNHKSTCITCRVPGLASDRMLLHCQPFEGICEYFSSQHDTDFALHISLHNAFITILLTSSNNPPLTSPLPLNKRSNTEPINHFFSKGKSRTYNTECLKTYQVSRGTKWNHGCSTSGASSFPLHLWKCGDCFLGGGTPKASAKWGEGVYS